MDDDVLVRTFVEQSAVCGDDRQAFVNTLLIAMMEHVLHDLDEAIDVGVGKSPLETLKEEGCQSPR